MIARSGNLASRSAACSGPGGSANVARSRKRMRDVWRDTPAGAIVHSSDSDIALSSCVSTPNRARHPDPSNFKLLSLMLMRSAFLQLDFQIRPGYACRTSAPEDDGDAGDVA